MTLTTQTADSSLQWAKRHQPLVTEYSSRTLSSPTPFHTHTRTLSNTRAQRFIFGAIAKLRKATVSLVMSVRLSVRMEQFSSPRTDFREIWIRGFFQKPVEKIQVPLNSDKNNRYFTWRPIYIYDNISLSSSQTEKYFTHKLQRKSKHTFCVHKSFPKIVSFIR